MRIRHNITVVPLQYRRHMVTESEFPPSLGKVARRELAGNGITRYEQLPDLTPGELLSIHGVGPKAVRILEDELSRRGLTFRSTG